MRKNDELERDQIIVAVKGQCNFAVIKRTRASFRLSCGGSVSLNTHIAEVHKGRSKRLLDCFTAELRQLPREAFSDAANMLSFLTDNPVDPVSLEPHLSWNRRIYTRNLIDRTEIYELIAVCWEIGQASSIHDHNGQQCWMTVPSGRLLVENYHVLNSNLRAGKCRIEKTSSVEIHSEKPELVDSSDPVHRVSNPHRFDERAVSLHVYSRPIEKCMVYSEETQTCGVVDLSYTSTPHSRKMIERIPD